jgi:hypothetical protein
MWALIIRLKNGRQTRGNGVLFWACLLSLLCGVLEIGLPLENTLRYGRNALRPQQASGDIVVVGIDGRSLNETKKRWPWPRADLAKLIDELNAAGAKRIFFDFNFDSYKVYLATRFVDDQSTGKRTDHVSIPEFAAYSKGANINVWVDPFGIPQGFLYQVQVADKIYPSMASLLGGASGPTNKLFRADYAIKVDSIPRASAVDVLRKRYDTRNFAGKDVIIASSTIELGDMYRLPGSALTSGVYFTVLAAETLKRGVPEERSWFGPWVVGIFMTAAFMGQFLASGFWAH